MDIGDSRGTKLRIWGLFLRKERRCPIPEEGRGKERERREEGGQCHLKGSGKREGVKPITS